MKLTSKICPKCFIVNYYDFSFRHIDPDSKEESPFVHYCTFCKADLDGPTNTGNA